MRTVLLPLCLAVAAYGQSALVTAAVSAPAKGPVELAVRNHGRVAIMAYAYTVTYTLDGKADTKEEIWDAAAALDLPEIQPNAQGIRRIGGAGYSNVTLDFHAAIFADGSTFGDAVWVRRMVANRRAALATLDAVRDKVKIAVTAEIPHVALMAQLHEAKPPQADDAYYERLIARLGRLESAQGQLREIELMRERLANSLPILGPR